jgi:glycosyltransferase involved in cell wall biosynthesis
MACARAVVASRIDGTTDAFEESFAVRLVPPEDAICLAEALSILIEDRHIADRMGYSGRKLVVGRFDRRAAARKIVEEVASCRNQRFTTQQP